MPAFGVSNIIKKLFIVETLKGENYTAICFKKPTEWRLNGIDEKRYFYVMIAML